MDLAALAETFNVETDTNPGPVDDDALPYEIEEIPDELKKWGCTLELIEFDTTAYARDPCPPPPYRPSVVLHANMHSACSASPCRDKEEIDLSPMAVRDR